MAFAAALVWLLQRVVVWRRTQHRPRGLHRSTATAVLLGFLLFVAVQPHDAGYHRIQCRFGVLGFGVGSVWIKVEPDNEQVKKIHRLHIAWGAMEATPAEELLGDTYFTFGKNDLRSPGTDVVVEPPVKLTCGNGSPPPDATRVAVTPELWKRRP